MTQPDPFDALLTLEDTLYTTAYTLGAQDGSRAGRIEGRVFGLEKGFEKFSALGSLHGRAVVWGSRILVEQNHNGAAKSTPEHENGVVAHNGSQEQEHDGDGDGDEGKRAGVLVPLTNGRLKKHVYALHALTDPQTFSMLNTEDAVADFDDRVKRATAKAKIIERMAATSSPRVTPTTQASSSGSTVPRKEGSRGIKLGGESRPQKGDDSMEDFTGSRFLS